MEFKESIQSQNKNWFSKITSASQQRFRPKKVLWECPICNNMHDDRIEHRKGCYEVYCPITKIHYILKDRNCGKCNLRIQCMLKRSYRVSRKYRAAEWVVVLNFKLSPNQNILLNIHQNILNVTSKYLISNNALGSVNAAFEFINYQKALYSIKKIESIIKNNGYKPIDIFHDCIKNHTVITIQ